MPTTTITVVDSLKLALNDRGGRLLSDAEYEQFALGHASGSGTWAAQRVAAGLWRVAAGPLCLLAPSFEPQPGASYTLTAGGAGIYGVPSIALTAGTDTRERIDLSGCALDFGRCLEELLVFIATHRAQEYAQTLGSAQLSPQSARAELLRQAEILRGVKAI